MDNRFKHQIEAKESSMGQQAKQFDNSQMYQSFPNYQIQQNHYPAPFPPFQHYPAFPFPCPMINVQMPSFQNDSYNSNFNQFHSLRPTFYDASNRNDSSIRNRFSLPKKYSKWESFSEDKVLSHKDKQNSVSPQVQLWKFSKQFRDFYKALKKLETDVESLKLQRHQMDENSWNNACKDMTLQKEQLLDLKQSINTEPEFLRLMKRIINKRRKKRKLMKKRKLSKVKMPTKYEIAEKHMQQLQQSADKKKQDEKLKIEADQVLSTVRQKKSEANYQINLLSALMKLHYARIQSSNSAQKYLSDTCNNGFYKIIEKLKMLWERHLEEYLIEERGLNIMVQDLAVTAKDEQCMNLKKTFGKWLKFIFGTTDNQKGKYYSNFGEFVHIRRDWDKFVVNEETNGSRIPAGWVIPKFHSNNSWTKLISEN